MDIERIIAAFEALDPHISELLDEGSVDRGLGIAGDRASGPKFADPEDDLLDPAVLRGASAACIIGVIDDDVPLLHPGLTRRTEEGLRSRIAAAWIMGARGPVGLPMGIGREITGTRIDRWLAERGPAGLDEEGILRREGLWDASRGGLRARGSSFTHGAAVAGLLAGYAPDDPAGGARPVVAVALPPEITRDTEGTFAPWFVYAALVFVLRRAAALARALGEGRRPPLVVNLSYGVSAGGKDGLGAVPALLEAFETGEGLPSRLRDDHAALGGIHFVLPMGNHRLARLHARLAPGAGPDVPAAEAPPDSMVHWVLPPADGTPSFLEIWGPPDAPQPPVRVAVTPPGGPEIVLPERGGAQGWVKEMTLEGAPLAMRVYRAIRPGSKRAHEDGRAREVLTIALPPTEPIGGPRRDGIGRPGAWRIRSLSDVPLDLHVQRDDAAPGYGGTRRQSRLVDRRLEIVGPDGRPLHVAPTFGVTEARSVNAYAAGDAMVRVGALRGDLSPAPYSGLGGEGAAPEGAPEAGDMAAVADRSGNAPGILVIGTVAGARGRASGTSMAAPRIARALADRLARGEELAGGTVVPAPEEDRPERWPGPPP